MGKRKKTITTAAITALIIGIFVLCCFLYTKNREKYYADNPMYFPDMIYCSSACNALVFDYDARGYAATSIRISGSDISFVPWFSLEHYVEPLKIRVSEFEKYMLYDYLNYVYASYKLTVSVGPEGPWGWVINFSPKELTFRYENCKPI